MKWRLKSYLDERQLTPYSLVKVAGVSPTTIYGIAQGKHERISLAVLDKVIWGLESLTGESVGLNDLLEPEPKPTPQPEMDAETRAWMDAELAPLLEPYEWGDVDPETLGQGRVEYVQGQGWIVTGEQAE